MHSTARLLEEAADELARLDAVSAFAPDAFSIALRLDAVVQLARISAPDATIDFASMAAAEGDPLHDTALPTVAMQWRDLVQGEERRVLGGATLTTARIAVVAPTLATYPERPRLEAIWRESAATRPVLERALDSAAWSPDPAVGEATAALQLCAGGTASRVRLLPFAAAAPEARRAAIDAHRAGDVEPWRQLGLATVSRRARAVRRAVEQAVRGLEEEDARLDAMRRAAITARRAHGILRRRAVTTMPVLAEELRLSRPAASDALERLVASGLAREVTGRARDRVYAYEAACAVADSANAASD